MESASHFNCTFEEVSAFLEIGECMEGFLHFSFFKKNAFFPNFRFHYSSYSKEKIDCFVDYPMVDFSLAKYCLSPDELNKKYDLYSVLVGYNRSNKRIIEFFILRTSNFSLLKYMISSFLLSFLSSFFYYF